MPYFIRSKLVTACLFAGAAALCVTGCGDSGGDAAHQTSADRALSDPWNYGPKVPGPDRGIRRADAKATDGKAPDATKTADAPRGDKADQSDFKRDLDHVLNP
ncbi:MAG: hypothetical protein JWO31_44 [Phycisphaerales bacterium]|nr:hypothetical protein [Phycisphaerales bacterium]